MAKLDHSTESATNQTVQSSFFELEVAPAITDRESWVTALRTARKDLRAQYLADDRFYREPSSAWAATGFVCGVVMLWDEDFFDAELGRFRVDAFLDDAIAQFGGYDAVILWHAYPKIGFDDRNQFDFYRDLPGGVDALSDIVTNLHRRGVRAILDYNPWDSGMRREPESDAAVLAQLVAAVDADAVFLDTLANADPSVRTALDAVRRGVVFQSEAIVPLADIADHLISWVQWPERLDQDLVIRNKWIEQRQMQHVVRRWHRDHRDELILAWLNGTGIVVWENVFGSWFPWSAEDKTLLKTMQLVFRARGPIFSEADWTPYVATSNPEVAASRWAVDGLVMWTVANRADFALDESRPWEDIPLGWEVLDGFTGAPFTATHVSIPPRGLAAIVAATHEEAESYRTSLAAAAASLSGAGAATTREADPVRLPVARSLGQPARGRTVEIAGGLRTIESAFRVRECGAYRRADFDDLSYPNMSGDWNFVRDIQLESVAVDRTPVTHGEFARFLDETGYRPPDPHHFLRDWSSGAPPAGRASHPVTWVSVDDARAFAEWAGGRLPTEDEWQVAISEAGAGFGASRVWEWTESEHSDGHTRFLILKGGADWLPGGSDWYAEGGPLSAERSAKFLLFAPSSDRSGTIGFRCCFDL